MATDLRVLETIVYVELSAVLLSSICLLPVLLAGYFIGLTPSRRNCARMVSWGALAIVLVLVVAHAFAAAA